MQEFGLPTLVMQEAGDPTATILGVGLPMLRLEECMIIDWRCHVVGYLL